MKKEFFGITESHYINLLHIREVAWRKNDYKIEEENTYCVMFSFDSNARITDIQQFNLTESKLNELKETLGI